MTATKKTEFKVNSVVVEDNALVINFTSDGVDKKKTMPFTNEGMKVIEDIKDFIENDEDFNPDNIWKYVKEWGIFYGLVVDLAEKERRVESKFAAIRAKAWLVSNPIDTL